MSVDLNLGVYTRYSWTMKFKNLGRRVRVGEGGKRFGEMFTPSDIFRL